MAFLDNTGLAYFWGKLKALFATKSELEVVRQSASKAYHYKGSVATVSDLPANAEQGDVYNVGTTLDGDNYAWTGTAWDKLGASVDLSPYALDANVVKLSGDQTIAGTKTISSALKSGTGDFLFRTVDNSFAGFQGGSSDAKGAFIRAFGQDHGSNPGFLFFRAKDATQQTDMVGKPDGTLTWGGKGFVYDSGNQTIAGNKTFSASPYYNLDQIFKFAFAHGTTPSAWTHRTISFSDNSGSEATEKIFGLVRSSIGTNGATRLQISAIQNVNTSPASATLDVNSTADGIIYATCPLIRPVNNNEFSCGSPTYKWTQVYAVSGTINTSDERLKTSISAVPDAVLDAWGDVQWAQFQMRDAIAEKGADKARIHNGLIAQRIDAVFKAHGLDASRYGLFCYDAWDAVAEEKDEDGNVVIPATEAGDAYSLRYEEALAMEAAYQRRRADRAEARMAELEKRISKLESVFDIPV